MLQAAHIVAVDYHLPDEVLTNADLSHTFDGWSADKIFSKTGIAQRHIAASGETAADLACHAALRLFENAGIDRAKIDFLIFCTQGPDYPLPTTACLLQHRLGLPLTCGAIDVNQGCSGYVYGLALAKGLIESGIRKNVLLLTGDTYSKYINLADRSVRTIFGDGAAATLIGAVAGAVPGIGPITMGTDGSGACNLIVPAGGARSPRTHLTAVESVDPSGNTRSQNDLFMNGSEIMTFTLSAIPGAMTELLAMAEKTMNDIDHVIFHQANAFLLEALRKKAKIPVEKFVVELDQVGNTVSSSIPIALARAKHKGKINRGDTALLLGFGVGYSWAGAITTVP